MTSGQFVFVTVTGLYAIAAIYSLGAGDYRRFGMFYGALLACVGGLHAAGATP
jgi:hypothetical protein